MKLLDHNFHFLPNSLVVGYGKRNQKKKNHLHFSLFWKKKVFFSTKQMRKKVVAHTFDLVFFLPSNLPPFLHNEVGTIQFLSGMSQTPTPPTTGKDHPTPPFHLVSPKVTTRARGQRMQICQHLLCLSVLCKKRSSSFARPSWFQISSYILETHKHLSHHQ